MKFYILILFPMAIVFNACVDNNHYSGDNSVSDKPLNTEVTHKYNKVPANLTTQISTGKTKPEELLNFSKGLIGIPYKYGSIDPSQGFDCSGFITYVFNHHGISVPRSSKDFTNVEREVNLKDSKAGDLILFTGTDSTVREVGHMGIITRNDGRDISFIHSTSGKANGVTVTPLSKYYQGRFVKTIRIFNP